MRADNRVRLVDAWVGVRAPSQATKVEHELIGLPVLEVSTAPAGADSAVEIAAWAKEEPN
jgi:hypothetical protein